MFLHLQCGGNCLVPASKGAIEQAASNPVPPCHHNEEAPGKKPEPSRAANGPCTQGQFAESKGRISGKVALVEIAAILPSPLALTVGSPCATLLKQENPLILFSSPPRISILRI